MPGTSAVGVLGRDNVDDDNGTIEVANEDRADLLALLPKPTVVIG